MRAHPQPISRRRLLALAGATAAFAATPANVRATAPLTMLRGRAFGTQWQISLPAAALTADLRARVVDVIDSMDRAFSPWRPDSTLSRFNNSRAAAVAISPEVAHVTQAALRIAEQSNGCFDPTVGPLVARWGFGPIHAGSVAPQGWRQLEIDGERLIRKWEGLSIDLCGIAKGHALDKIVQCLEGEGHNDFIIDLGGEFAARGRHPSGRDWRVAIENPTPGDDNAVEIIALSNFAIATSGDRVNAYDIGERRYSHIIDPSIQEPATGPLSSVSVISQTALAADGWATALMAAGTEGPELASRLGLTAMFLFRQKNGLRQVRSGSFNRHLA
jgi:thiamine biosynthesis lipoprotein